MFVNHYEILDVEPDADLVQITAAWKRLLKKYHPDLNQEDQDATEQAILINKAYEVLSDPKKRKRFDQQLEEFQNASDQNASDQNEADQNASDQNDANQQADLDEFRFQDEPNHASTEAEQSFGPQTSNSYSTSSFSASTKSKSKKQRYALVMSVVGILLGALTAIPIGLFLVWVISGYDPLEIFRQKQNEVVAEREDPEEKKQAEEKPNAAKNPGLTKKKVETREPDKITISYAKFGESRQTVRVEKFVEEVANKEDVITHITTEGLNTTNPVGRFRTLLRVTYQVNGTKTGTLTFKNGEKVRIREAILKHAAENGRPFEKIEITYALFGKRRNKVRCEEQIAAVASQIDTVVPITTHGLSLRNPGGGVRRELDIKYKVAGKTGELQLLYGQQVDLRKTILEHANVLDGSYTPSLTKADSGSPKSDPNKKAPEKKADPPAKQVAKADPKKAETEKKESPKQPVVETVTKLPIPPENDVATAKAKIAEIFKTDYEFAKRAKGMEELKLLNTLAGQVIKLAEKETDPTTLYAVYEIAIDISRESCFVDFMFGYVQQLELRFEVDGTRRRIDLLRYLRRQLPIAIQDKNLLRRINIRLRGLSKMLLIQSVEDERWQDAIDISDVYRGFCSALGEREKATVLKQATNLLKKRLNNSTKVARYLKELESNSTDADKMLPVGTYLCFTTQQWEKGLKYLGKCSDSKLAGIATSDLAANESNFLLVGDLWWDLALDEDYYDYRLPILSRAKYFYMRSLDKSTGIERTKIEKRLKDAEKAIWGDGFFFDFLNDFKSPSSGIKLILVRNGSFNMGEHQKNIDAFGKYASRYAHEGPRHPVTITKSFYLGQYEVTQEQWIRIMGTQPWTHDVSVTRGIHFPASYITWHEAKDFCKRLSALDKKKYRLPTEAEWEYACRAGTETRYYMGDSDKSVFMHDWVRENAYNNFNLRCGQRVGNLLPNPLGLYDLHGNVHEWCEDSYQADFYARSPKVDPVNRAEAPNKVRRSGTFYGNSWTGRSASRHFGPADQKHRRLGLRIVMER